MPGYRFDYAKPTITTRAWRDSEMHEKQLVEVIDACHDLIRTKVPGGWLYMVKPFRGNISDPAFVADSEAS